VYWYCDYDYTIKHISKHKTHALRRAMDETIPLLKQNTLKSFWSAELDELKQASINAHNLRVLRETPRQGITNKMCLDAKYKYKLAIKHASMNDSLEFDDELSNHFLRKDMTKFWRQWNTRFSKRNARPTNVNDYYKDEDIAELFCTKFYTNCFNSYTDNTCLIDCLNKLEDVVHAEGDQGDFIGYTLFDGFGVENGLKCLKLGKASDSDDVSKESITVKSRRLATRF